MSAIAGIFNLDGQPVAPGVLELLTARMAAHGPDGTHHYRSGAVALGHCLLHSRPLRARARQPATDASGELVVVFDGRLDNRAELAKHLGIDGAACADAEFVIAAYRAWGRDCPQRLDGDFVFGLWHASERRLFLAKDHVGARQVYYTITGSSFAFASFDEALLSLPGVPREPCAELVAGVLMPEFDDYHGEQTWLEPVLALKPAHSLCVSPAGVSAQRCYWTFEPQEERHFSSDAECAEAFVQVFESAVAKRIQGVEEPAALVSGGIDSASVLAALESAAAGPKRSLHAFSTVLEPVDANAESRCIVSMTSNPRIRSHVLSIPSFAGPVSSDDLMSIVWAHAHPVDNTLVMPAMLCLAAQRAGHRSLLHGASGDVLLTAPGNYAAALLRAGEWRAAWRECRAASEHHTYLMGMQPWELLLRNAWSAFAPKNLLRLVRTARSRSSRSVPQPGWLHPDFARRLRLTERVRAARFNSVEQSFAPRRTAHARSIFGCPGVASGLAGFQRVGSRHGLEMLDPWADRAVIEFILHLPLAHLVRDGWNKWPARTWLMRSFSDEVRWRTDKEHFGWQFTEIAMAASAEVVEHALAAPGKLTEFVDWPVLLAELRDRHDAPDGWRTQTLYDVVTLVLWLRRISNTAPDTGGNRMLPGG